MPGKFQKNSPASLSSYKTVSTDSSLSTNIHNAHINNNNKAQNTKRQRTTEKGQSIDGARVISSSSATTTPSTTIQTSLLDKTSRETTTQGNSTILNSKTDNRKIELDSANVTGVTKPTTSIHSSSKSKIMSGNNQQFHELEKSYQKRLQKTKTTKTTVQIYGFFHCLISLITCFISVSAAFYIFYQDQVYKEFLPKLSEAEKFYNQDFKVLLNEEIRELVKIETAKKLGQVTFKEIISETDSGDRNAEQTNEIPNQELAKIKENYINLSNNLDELNLQFKNLTSSSMKNFLSFQESLQNLQNKNSILNLKLNRKSIKLSNLIEKVEVINSTISSARKLISGNPSKVDLLNCFHDKMEIQEKKPVDQNSNNNPFGRMDTNWLGPKYGFVFTGITCSSVQGYYSYLEVKSVPVTPENLNGKEYRCSCFRLPESSDISLTVRTSLIQKEVSKCVINYWTCPMYTL